ncbi:MAG TPA: hypothetical protein DIS79_10615 [Bacteroidetes bacterium]|nr:hypothetical protein [Bacteroidota bacterium]HRK05949.1 VanZ family protein [Chlorobiota bacterium]
MKIVFLLPVLLCSGTLFYLSSIPGLTPPSLGVAWQDKVYHAIAFLGYGLTVLWASMGLRPSASRRSHVVFTVALSIVFAVSDELHQYVVPNRQAGIDDVLADVVGVLLSLTMMPLVSRMVRVVYRRLL